MTSDPNQNLCASCGELLDSSKSGVALCGKCSLDSAISTVFQSSQPSRKETGNSLQDPAPSAKSGEKSKANDSLAEHYPSIEEMGILFPELEIAGVIGAGGMGAVFEGRQPALDRPVAIKVLGNRLAEDESFVERFRREARAMARLNHPNIVSIYEFGERGGYHFFLMEYVDGGDLEKLIRRKALSPSAALELIPQICEAIQFAHDEGITHRDIKPANILLDRKGRVKIADFGLAKILQGDHDGFETLAGTAMGTPFYMAPEQMKGNGEVDQRADIYSLGVLAYQMLTGHLPHGDFAPPSQSVPAMGERIDDAIMRAMAQDPRLRFQDVREMIEAIDLVRRDQSRTFQKWSKLGILLGGFAILTAAYAFWQWVPGEREGYQETSGKEATPKILDRIERPTIPIPPDLLAMRKRGGVLRLWPEDALDSQPEKLEHFIRHDDLTEIRSAHVRGNWVGLRANGCSVAAGPFLDNICGVSDLASGSHGLVLADDSVLIERNLGFDSEEAGAKHFAQIASCFFYGIFLRTDGTILPFAWNQKRRFPEFWLPLKENLEQVHGIVYCTAFDLQGAILDREGAIYTWNLLEDGNLHEAPIQFDDVVSVSNRGPSYLAIRRKGEIVTWSSNPDLNHFPVPELPPAVDASLGPNFYAVQLEDGSWRAWGSEESELQEEINSLGPVVDLEIIETDDGWGFLWIEPVAESN